MTRLLSLSERRRRTARINGAKSRGPVTAAGKARSSRNAFKHGFRSNHILPEELPPDFVEAAQELIDDLNPTSPLESALAREMAFSWHRMKQLWYMEAAALRKEMASLPNPSGPDALGDAFTNLVNDGTLPLLNRYEVNHENRWYRASGQLLDLRFPRAARGRKKRQVPNEPAKAISPATPTSPRQFQPGGQLLNTPVPNEPAEHLTHAATANSSQFLQLTRICGTADRPDDAAAPPYRSLGDPAARSSIDPVMNHVTALHHGSKI
jgi:hypothetical protein